MMLVDDNTKAIVDKIVDTAKAGAIEIYGKIQQAAPELWKLAVRQQWINGIEYLTDALFSLLMIAFGIWAFKKALKCNSYLDEPLGITGAVLILAGTPMFLMFLINGLGLVLNPQYWALHDILEMVKGH